jgi:hypothetical protein
MGGPDAKMKQLSTIKHQHQEFENYESTIIPMIEKNDDEDLRNGGLMNLRFPVGATAC